MKFVSSFLSVALFAGVFAGLFAGCASPSLEEQSKEDLSHYIWSLTLVAPAIAAAVGPFEDPESFNPEKVYEKAHRRSLESGSKEEMVVLASSLSEKSWQSFAQNLLYYYGEEGSEEVAQAMRELDQEEFELDYKKAAIIERISMNSYNYHMVDILFSKVGRGASSGESFLYRKSLFVTTYLAAEDFSVEELKEFERIRSNKLYQAYKGVLESVVSGQYDDVLKRLKARAL